MVFALVISKINNEMITYKRSTNYDALLTHSEQHAKLFIALDFNAQTSLKKTSQS